MKAVFCGGGTGGHVYPLLAVIEKFKEKYPEANIIYLGSKKGLEAKAVPENGIRFHSFDIEGFQSKKILSVLKTITKAIIAFMKAGVFFRRERPDIVLGSGGYVCGPLLIAAYTCRIPILLHEQNVIPGKTNKLLSYFAAKILLTFHETDEYINNKNKIVFSGMPIRDRILFHIEDCSCKNKRDVKNLLIVGGSGGAKTINKTMLDFYRIYGRLIKYQITHITGERDYAEIKQIFSELPEQNVLKEKIKLLSYHSEIGCLLANADLCISRAGASFLSEIAIHRLPAILIPFPHAALNHQELNARAFINSGAAEMIKENELTIESLYEKIEDLMYNDEKLDMISRKLEKFANKDATLIIIKTMEEYL